MKLPWTRKLSAARADWIINLHPDGTYQVVKGPEEPHTCFETVLFIKDADLEKFEDE